MPIVAKKRSTETNSKNGADRTPKAAISTASKRAPAAAAATMAARKVHGTQYGEFSAALREISTTIDEIRVINDRAAKRLA